MGALLGLSIAGVLALPWREFMRWRRYWNEEPWGARRDNMHAAMIVSELLKPHYKEGATPLPMSNFMLEIHDDEVDDAAAAERFVAQLDAMARADARRRR